MSADLRIKPRENRTLCEASASWNCDQLQAVLKSLAGQARSEGGQDGETESYCIRTGYKLIETFVDRG
jgi:hypothetical protein